MINTQQIKAIGFDVDGTLYTYSPQVSIALSRQVAQVAAKLLGRDDDSFVEEYLVQRDKYRSNTLALNSMGLDGEQIYQEVMDQFPLEQHEGKNVQLIKVMAELKKRYRLFIISNGTGRQVERKLATLGLDVQDFDPRIYCYDHDWAKPDPAPFLLALESLKLQPEQVVYVGDRDDVDIAGAQAVGMRAIRVGGESQSAEASVESVYDIVSVL